jgi:NAD-dependent deacetylase
MSDPFQIAAEALQRAEYAIASTGAGISVESGIPDFRSPGGIWSKYPPEEYATIDAFMRDPAKVWRFWNDLGTDIQNCRPNPAHNVLAELESTGKIKTVITQNVDNLHQEAGSKNVIEYHGNARRLVCLECGGSEPYVPGERREALPRCPCGGVLKPDVVMFGEMIPMRAMLEAEAMAYDCDLILIVGTSAQVYPAADLPNTAKRNGAFVIEANTEETDFTSSITDAFLKGPAGQTLPRLLERLKQF